MAAGAAGAGMPAPTAAPVRRAMLSYVPGAGSSAAVIQVVCLGGETCVEDKARETGRPRTRLRQLAEAVAEAGGRPEPDLALAGRAGAADGAAASGRPRWCTPAGGASPATCAGSSASRSYLG